MGKGKRKKKKRENRPSVFAPLEKFPSYAIAQNMHYVVQTILLNTYVHANFYLTCSLLDVTEML